MSVFYDHLHDQAELEAALGMLSPAEQAVMVDIYDAALQHAVLDTIFQAIPRSTHEWFLVQFSRDPVNPEHLTFLQNHESMIEDQLRKTIQTTQRQFIDTIHAT